jgi:asparagine synthetase B (glutamine-hydrolysing)
VFDISVAGYQQEYRRAIGEMEFGLFLTYQSMNMCPEMFFFDPMDVQLELGLCPAPAFWDEDLVSLAMSLPTGLKLKGSTTKYILRKAASLNMDKKYWMLPKIGLQSSYEFLSSTSEGDAWRRERMDQARQSAEYRRLVEVVPGEVDPDRLVPLVVWKERQGIA